MRETTRKQQHNRRLSTDSSLSHGGGGGGGLNAFYLHQTLALDSAVVEVQEMFSSHGFFYRFVALRSKSTALVMAGRSVHLTTLFLGKLEQAVNQYFVHILSMVNNNKPS